MGYQKIKGIKVEPVGGANRHLPNKVQYWDNTGYAFGGWIYNTQLNIGFSQQPTTIELDIALDTQSPSANNSNALNSTGPTAGVSFDISSGDLSVSYDPARGENYYKVNVGDNVYSPMHLVSYDINGGSDSKTLRAKFVDYSSILDKVYVGLFKRQGYDKTLSRQLATNPKVDAMCPDCSLSGVDYWHVTGSLSGSVDFGSYFYNHRGARNLLPDPAVIIPMVGGVLNKTYSNYFLNRTLNHVWQTTDAEVTEIDKLNINGGTLIIGCEEFNQTLCGNLAPVTYNFSELILALNTAGIKFSRANSTALSDNWTSHISGKIDKNPSYRQNYIGTLREVLNNWCSDFALDFYVTGKTICFIDLAQDTFPVVSNLTKVMIPNPSLLGSDFNSNTNFAIASYTEKVDMSDTYEQKIITFDARPRKTEDKEKIIKNQCGFIAMHPLDFLGYNERTTTGHRTIYDQGFTDNYILNPIWDATPGDSLKNMPVRSFTVPPAAGSPPGTPGIPWVDNYYTSAGGAYRSHWYTQRPYILIDICAALGRYSTDLRGIFLGGLISTKLKEAAEAVRAQASSFIKTGPSASNTMNLTSLFNSFGFTPLTYLDEPNYADFKQSFIEKMLDKKTSDNRQNYILNSINFEMVIGFHTEESQKEILDWEKVISTNMYKQGVLVKGNLKKAPYLTPNRTDQPPFFAGLTGISGLKVTKIDSTTEPSSERYIDFSKLPFGDLYQTSGEYSNPLTNNLNWSGMSIAELDNEWGTLEDDFVQKMKSLSPHAECDNFKQSAFFTEGDSYSSPAGFNLSDFSPQFFEITDDLFDELEDELRNAVANKPGAGLLLGKLIEVKRESRPTPGGDPNYTQYKCPKLKVMVIPNVSQLQRFNVPLRENWSSTTATSSNPQIISALSPHLGVNFTFGSGINPVMAGKIAKTLEEKRIAKLKDFPKNFCDTDITTEICNLGRPILGGKLPGNATQTLPYGVPTITECREYSNSPIATQANCGCVSDYTGEYWFGFSSGDLTVAPNCRTIRVDFVVNNTALIKANLNTDFFTINEKGHVKIVSDDEDYPDFTQRTTGITIYYPIQSAPLPSVWAGSVGIAPPQHYPYKYYSGLLTTNLSVQVRNPEIVEVHGNYWSGISNVAKVQQINNEIDQDIEQQVNPVSKTFFKPVYDMQGNRISSVSGYHNLITGMSENSNRNPNLSLTFEIVGDAAEVSNFKNALTPASGLSNFSYSLGQEGYRTNVTFASKPKTLPKREAILNQIRPRL